MVITTDVNIMKSSQVPMPKKWQDIPMKISMMLLMETKTGIGETTKIIKKIQNHENRIRMVAVTLHQ